MSANPMIELASRLTSNHFVTLLVVAMVLIAAVLLSAVSAWGKVRQSQIAANLKQDMLDRGMSAEEIKTILGASSDA